MKTNNFKWEENFAFQEGDIVVIGCSSGSDSMALFHMLLQIRKRINISLICAHVNHNVRSESKEEMAFLREYCKEHDVVFESMIIEKYGDDNFHNEARAIRYQFFEDVVQKYQANYLATAHHGDDLMETILMRLSRGSTLKGYAGFESVVNKNGYQIIRPLISYTKEELLAYVKQNHIPYYEDASNHKMKYTRNRYRKHVLPFLKEEDSKVHEKFFKFSTLLHETNAFINREVDRQFRKVFSDNQLNLERLEELDPFLQKRLLYSILENIYQDDLILITDRHFELIEHLINSKKPNQVVYLPNDFVAIKSYSTITFQKRIDEILDYEIELNDYVTLPNHHHLEMVSESNDTSNDVCRLDSKDILLPLSVRTRKLGDKMTLKNSAGKKKLKDIFIDKKVKIQDRDVWPVVVDAKGEIVWLPGLQKSKFDKQKTENYDIIIKYQ